ADQFGYYIKIPQEIWRARPTFNGQLVFMTPMADGTKNRLRVGQAPAGLLNHSPSALVPGEPLPTQRIGDVTWGPDRDAEGTALSVATPSPCPPNLLVVSAAPLQGEGQAPEPGKYGLYLVSDDWKSARKPVPQLLFDDPALVDAEPVAVYPRPIKLSPEAPHTTSEKGVPPLLADGRPYSGSIGLVEN